MFLSLRWEPILDSTYGWNGNLTGLTMKIGSANIGFQTEDAIPLSATLVPIVTIKQFVTEYLGYPYSKCAKPGINGTTATQHTFDLPPPETFMEYNEK